MRKCNLSLIPKASGLGLLFYCPYLGDLTQGLHTGELLPKLKCGTPHFDSFYQPGHLQQARHNVSA